MAKEDVVETLSRPEFTATKACLGQMLLALLNEPQWRNVLILQRLESSPRHADGWERLFRRTADCLSGPDLLAAKADQVLGGVRTARFDGALDDFVAECLAVLHLAATGHTDVRFLPEDAAITVDLESRFSGSQCFTEVKNLREPRSLSFVAFRRWNTCLLDSPQRFAFRADFLDLDDPLSDLTAEQERAVCKLVDELPNRKRPSDFISILPGGRRVRVRLAEGAPLMLRHGGGPFLVGPVVEKASRSLLLKLMDPARKALVQLYSPEVPEDAKRLLLVRWKLPEEIGAIGEGDNVRQPVAARVQSFLSGFFPNLAVTIMHTGEEPEKTPPALWT